MTTYLGKSGSFSFPRVPFVNCRQFMYLVISLLVLRAGCGIWLYQFLIIAYLFTLWPSVGKALSPWLVTCVVFFILMSSLLYVSLPVWCLGQDVEFDCICSWSLPFPLCSIWNSSSNNVFQMMILGWPWPFLWQGHICFLVLLLGWKLICSTECSCIFMFFLIQHILSTQVSDTGPLVFWFMFFLLSEQTWPHCATFFSLIQSSSKEL